MSTVTANTTVITYTVKAVALRRAYAVLKAANPHRESGIGTVRLMWDGYGNLVIALPPTAHGIKERAVSLNGSLLASDWAEYLVTRFVAIDTWERAIKGTTGMVNVTAHSESVTVGTASVPSVDAGPEWGSYVPVDVFNITAHGVCHVGADDLKFVGIAAGVDDRLSIFNGVFFDGWRIAATDRYRLHVAPTTWDSGADWHFDVVVPWLTLKAVLRTKPDAVTVAHTEWPNAGVGGAVIVSATGSYGERVEITVEPICGNFPKWRDLVPETNDSNHVGICEREEFKRIMTAANVAIRNMPIRFTLSTNAMQSVGTILAECGNVDDGYAMQEMTARLNVLNELTNGRTIAFNPAFMSDILATLPGDGYVRWFQTESHRPAVFKPLTDDSRLALLMPVRI